MADLNDMKHGRAKVVLTFLEAKINPALGDAIIDDPSLVGMMVEAAQKYLDTNPYEMTVEDQITALRRANDVENWGTTEEEIACLTATAPAWPKGKHAYRSFRIRWGEADTGVDMTFERHAARIKTVFGENRYWRAPWLLSGKIEYRGKSVGRLRLLNGNRTHKPIIEWVVVDLDAHRKGRVCAADVRGGNSLADELLVIAWLFPEMIKMMGYEDGKLSGLVAGGYEVNRSEDGGEDWTQMVIVGFSSDDIVSHGKGVCLSLGHRGSSIPGCSVPVSRSFLE